MAQSMIQFRIDTDEKKSFEQVCAQLGLSITSAFKLFTKKVVREQRIPFDVSLDRFYAPDNIRYLEQVTAEIDAGTAPLHEHALIDDANRVVYRQDGDNVIIAACKGHYADC